MKKIIKRVAEFLLFAILFVAVYALWIQGDEILQLSSVFLLICLLMYPFSKEATTALNLVFLALLISLIVYIFENISKLFGYALSIYTLYYCYQIVIDFRQRMRGVVNEKQSN